MNIAFYPFWAARTLLSLIHVISITTMTCLLYRQIEFIPGTLLFLGFYAVSYAAAKFAFPFLMKRFALSRLIIGIPLTKTLLLIGISVSLPDLTLHTVLMFTGAVVLSAASRWESLFLEELRPKLVEREDIMKTNSLLSFSKFTVSAIGLVMTGITILYLGPIQALWAAACLSLAALAMIVTVHHLIHSHSSHSLKRGTRQPLHHIKKRRA